MRQVLFQLERQSLRSGEVRHGRSAEGICPLAPARLIFSNLMNADASTSRMTALMLVVLASPTGWGQTASCFPDLHNLTYPASALKDRIQGTVDMSFTVNSEGKAAEIHSNAYPSLKESVEVALQSSRMVECSGKRISIQVNFRFDDSIDPKSPISARRTSESAYEIVAPVELIEITISDPEWSFTRRGRALHRIKTWVSKLRFW